MDRYLGVKCPVCGQPFQAGDDIVVCPVCGAPHHRACYHELGHCALEEEHASGKAWQPPRPEPAQPHGEEGACEGAGEDPSGGEHGEILCPVCHTRNPAGNIFCQSCGAPLRPDEEDAGDRTEENPYGQPYTRGPGMGGPGGWTGSFPLMFNPYGGLEPEEEIEGIKVKELAAYIGPNAAYYLPRFRSLSGGKGKLSFNWSAMIAGFLYFLYRKIYPIGILAAILFALFITPAAIFYIEVMGDPALLEGLAMGTLRELPEHLLLLQRIQSVVSYVYLGFCILMGFFANQIYKSQVFTQLRKLKEEAQDLPPLEQLQLMRRRGGVNRQLITIVLAAFLVLNFLFTLFVVYA